jgi:hypothetical protein
MLPANLHFLFQLVAQDAVELLHIVLHEGIVGAPAKGGGQILGGDREWAVLQLRSAFVQSAKLKAPAHAQESTHCTGTTAYFEKQGLQGDGDACRRLHIFFGRHMIHSLPQEQDFRT